MHNEFVIIVHVHVCHIVHYNVAGLNAVHAVFLLHVCLYSVCYVCTCILV